MPLIRGAHAQNRQLIQIPQHNGTPAYNDGAAIRAD
jgi:hypothetical protein